MSTRKLSTTRSGESPDLCARVSERPLLTVADVIPSDPRLEVIGVLNPTFIAIEGRRYLIVRIDERPVAVSEQSRNMTRESFKIPIARVDTACGSRIQVVEAEVPESYNPEKEPILPKSVRHAVQDKGGPDLLLSYLSSLRCVRLLGTKHAVDSKPLAFPDNEFSQFGCEDPRATLLEGQPVLTYTSVGRFGATAWFARLTEQCALRGKTMLLGPDHKHCALFPEKIGQAYCMLSRPLTRLYIQSNGIWVYKSPDLLHWGEACPILLPRQAQWDSVRVGPCMSPLETSEGWLLFYFGVDSEDSYHVGAALLDRNDPSRVIGRAGVPILSPILDWERVGRRADTVFPCGAEFSTEKDSVRLYYGAADTCIGAANLSLSTLWNVLVKDD